MVRSESFRSARWNSRGPVKREEIQEEMLHTVCRIYAAAILEEISNLLPNAAAWVTVSRYARGRVILPQRIDKSWRGRGTHRMTSCIGRSLAARLLGRFFVGADREAGVDELQPLQRFKDDFAKAEELHLPIPRAGSLLCDQQGVGERGRTVLDVAQIDQQLEWSVRSDERQKIVLQLGILVGVEEPGVGDA